MTGGAHGMYAAAILVLMTGCAPDAGSARADPVASWQQPHATSEQDPPREPPAPPQFKDPKMARYHMRRHFDDLRIIEQLLLAGQLVEGTTLARFLARPYDDPGVADWQGHARRIADAALALSEAHGQDEALRREVQVAAECASCHLEAQGSPRFVRVPLVPQDDGTPKARMARHAWAADRLWEGLVGPADDRWSRGLVVLSDTPLPLTTLTDAPALGRRLQELARVQLTTRATTLLEARTSAYGEMLVTCAACHSSLRVIPR